MNNVTEPTYDAATCITAGELRSCGVPVPENIPDCGWLPRAAMRVRNVASESTAEDIAAGRLCVGMDVEFMQPFRWLQVTLTVDKKL